MAARGRGRGGWRGGRSGGRGGMQAPALRDDEGNFIEAERNEGPPPLFPVSTCSPNPDRAQHSAVISVSCCSTQQYTVIVELREQAHASLHGH